MKRFCIKCDKKVPYKIVYNGKEFQAFCKYCGEEIYVPDVNDCNCAKRLYEFASIV